MHCNRRLALAFILATFSAFSARFASAAIIDDFSVNSSSSYNILTVYQNNAAVYARTNNQFTPTGGSGSTNHILRNTGEVLGIAGGDTVAIDIVSLPNSGTSGGLGFSSSLTSEPAGFEAYIYNSNGTYSFNQGYNLSNVGLNLLTPATLTITRQTADNSKFDFVLSGGGLSNPYQGTMTIAALLNIPVYFGPQVYNTPSAALDNLSFTAVPEPSTLALLSGLGVSLLLRRRRR